MLTPDGPMTAYGEYLEIDPPKKLSFTWGWRQIHLDGSIVTLSFRDLDGSTDMTLENFNFPAAEVAEHHKMGWTSIADKLGQFVERWPSLMTRFVPATSRIVMRRQRLAVPGSESRKTGARVRDAAQCPGHAQ